MLLAALTAFTPPAGSMPNTTPAPAASAVPAPRPAASWGWPLDPTPAVARPFHAPPTPWSAGHRGVDLTASVGQPVLSAGAGRVTFAALVAGRGVIVVTHPGGLRTSYEPVTDTAVVGALVRRGGRIGVVAGVAGHCAPATCLHWGLRRGDTYLDPLTLLGAGPPVLKPPSGDWHLATPIHPPSGTLGR